MMMSISHTVVRSSFQRLARPSWLGQRGDVCRHTRSHSCRITVPSLSACLLLCLSVTDLLHGAGT